MSNTERTIILVGQRLFRVLSSSGALIKGVVAHAK